MKPLLFVAAFFNIENEYFCNKFYGERCSFKKNKDGETQIDIEIILWDCISNRMPIQNIQEALKLLYLVSNAYNGS